MPKASSIGVRVEGVLGGSCGDEAVQFCRRLVKFKRIVIRVEFWMGVN